MPGREQLMKCPLCAGELLENFLVSNGERVVRCKSCELLFVNPRPTQAAICKLFSDEYIETEERVTEHFTDWRYDSLQREASTIQQLMQQGGRLLDLGTASGAFLSFFSDIPQWQVEGIEPSRYAAEAAAKHYNVPVHAGFLHDQQFPDEYFDVVTSLDAFMFHPEPQADLAEITRILRPGGLLAVEIPGLRFRLLKNSGPLCRLLYGVPARLNAGTHLFYYSRKTLGLLLAQHGLHEILAIPERSPLYGSWPVRLMNTLYFRATRSLYHVTGGAGWVPVPKEFLVYRKEEA